MKIKTIIASSAAFLLLVTALPTQVMAASLSDLESQATTTQSKIDSVNSQISSAMKSVNEKYAEVAAIKTKIADNEASIKSNSKKLEEQTANLESRKEYAKNKLRALQQNDNNSSSINALLSAKSLTDFFSRAYAVVVLQNADNENMAELKTAYEATTNLKQQLSEDKNQLASQKATLDTQTTELETQLADLKTTLANNKDALAQIAQAKETEQQRLDAAAAAAAAAKEQAAKTAAANVAATTNTTTTTNTGNTTLTGTSTGQTMTMQSTAYSYAEAGASQYGASGIDLKANPMVIAVDPSVIPLGTLVQVSGYGVAIAGDTGGAIQGNIIDVHFSTVAQCTAWGRRSVTVTILS